MAVYGYTKNYKLIKPQFDTDTWHDYEYDNLDTIDAVLSAIFASGDWQGFWRTNTHYDAGGVVIDRDTDTMYKIMVEHTTSEATFAEELAAHPTYYELWSPNNLAEDWATKMDGLVSSVDYSSKAYAISSALIDAGSAKEWAIETGGTIGTTGQYSAKKHANDAASSASTATSQASAASASATLASKWATQLTTPVEGGEYSAKQYAQNAATSASTAASYASEAHIDAGGASGSATAAAASATLAQDWATKIDGKVASTDYSSKYYAEQSALSAQQAAISAAGTHFKLFQHQWFDYELNDMAWLRADTFSWQSGTVYTNAMDHLIEDIGYVRYIMPDDGLTIKFYRDSSQDTDDMYAWTNSFSTLYTENKYPSAGDDFYYNGQVAGTLASVGIEAGASALTPTTETVGGYTVTFYRATDGHKIVLADQETTVGNIYTSTGVAWYYVLDTVNNRFKLPRTKYGFNGLRGNVGDYIPESLPNVTGEFSLGTNTGIPSGALKSGAFKQGNATYANGPSATATTTYSLGFDASNSSSVYQNGAGVQQRGTQQYLYFYVGQFSQSAIEQTAGLNAELFNGKADINAANFSSDGKSLLSGLGMPSRYTNLTLGASGATYRAPANGWFNAITSTTASGINVGLMAINTTTGFYAGEQDDHAGYRVASFLLPVRKGDVMQFYYYGYTAMSYFRFFYAEGDN